MDPGRAPAHVPLSTLPTSSTTLRPAPSSISHYSAFSHFMKSSTSSSIPFSRMSFRSSTTTRRETRPLIRHTRLVSSRRGQRRRRLGPLRAGPNALGSRGPFGTACGARCMAGTADNKCTKVPWWHLPFVQGTIFAIAIYRRASAAHWRNCSSETRPTVRLHAALPCSLLKAIL